MRVYYKDAHAAIVVCDCTKRDTVAGAFRWKKDLDYKLALENGEPVPAVLLANKVRAAAAAGALIAKMQPRHLANKKKRGF